MWRQCFCEKISIFNPLKDQIRVMNLRFSLVIDSAAHSGCHIKRKQMIRMKLVWHICERERLFSFMQRILNPFVAVGWFINHYFFVKFFFLEEKIIPKIFQTFGWCIYPVSVTLWAPWLGDFDNLNLFYRKIKIEKMPKFEILFATRGLIKIF